MPLLHSMLKNQAICCAAAHAQANGPTGLELMHSGGAGMMQGGGGAGLGGGAWEGLGSNEPLPSRIFASFESSQHLSSHLSSRSLGPAEFQSTEEEVFCQDKSVTPLKSLTKTRPSIHCPMGGERAGRDGRSEMTSPPHRQCADGWVHSRRALGDKTTESR
jgi:hypothetical protein